MSRAGSTPWDKGWVPERNPYPAGFTLMEMLIVVIVLAILATAALPNYTRAVERSYWRSANDILLAMYTGEQVAKIGSANNKFPDGDGGADCAAAWTCIYMDAPDTAEVNYSVTRTGGGAGFTAKAKRLGGQFKNETRTVDETKVFGGTGTWGTATGP